ncbi:MAG: hypothetical protein KZQ63_21480 [Candidatus Thiodiazotropha sp. (ex Lucinoma aequizonata)]|nr:hypothetical protein [Candidatus Thiodiazotropha sp. (ex Lucinoma aequizonata)]
MQTGMGMGMLIAVSIIAGALIMGGCAALLFAALAALAVITDQVHASLSKMAIPPNLSRQNFLALFFSPPCCSLWY